MSIFHFGMVVRYLIPLAFYLLIVGLVLHGEMRRDEAGWKEMIVNIVLMLGAYVVFLLLQYIPLFSGGTLLLPEAHLPTILLIPFLPIFTIAALVATYFYRKTGHVFVGSFINAMLVTWIIVAGQATHDHFQENF